jgi:hypothetical protein
MLDPSSIQFLTQYTFIIIIIIIINVIIILLLSTLTLRFMKFNYLIFNNSFLLIEKTLCLR